MFLTVVYITLLTEQMDWLGPAEKQKLLQLAALILNWLQANFSKDSAG